MVKSRHSGVRRRYPVVNGIFYPDCQESIIAALASWGLRDVSINGRGSSGLMAIIAPHAAWDISGTVAGAAFAAAQYERAAAVPAARGNSVRNISRVVLLGPCHASVEEGIYLSESVSFHTPLGELPVDQRLNREMASCSTFIRINDIPHLSEHCLEVLLPLVKYCFGGIRIVPILVSGARPAIISCLARALRITLEKYINECLIVISSNVSWNSNAALAMSMAGEFQSLLESMDAEAFLAALAAGRVSACGGAPVGALLESGLLDGSHFSAVGPLVRGIEEQEETVYYGAFACGAHGG